MRLESTNTFLTVTSLAMFSVTSILVGLLVCGPDTGATPECDPDALTIQCPEGLVCNEFGFCEEQEPPTALPDCSPGQRASECVCPDHLEVRDEICDVPPTTSVCEHADVASLLERLRQECTREDTATAPGNLDGCSPAALRSVIIGSHELTMKIARSFREQSFTLHFNIGTPRARTASTWPGRATRPALVKTVKDMLEHAAPHGYLLMVSFASHVGPDDLNFELAARRSDAAVSLISKARGDFPALDKTLEPLSTIVGIVGDKREAAVDLATFDAVWGTSDRFHAWDDASTARMKKALAAWRTQNLAPLEEAWLIRTVQQSVLVLPLPCDPAPAEAHG
jgi:hypothetical protein